jgi:hypothetical protein
MGNTVLLLIVVHGCSRGKKHHIRCLNKLIESCLGAFAHILLGENPPRTNPFLLPVKFSHLARLI